MISPSKVKHQQQQHKQPPRDHSDIHSHVRLQRGRKPLEKKSFYLDIKNHRLLATLEEKIKGLGGIVEVFLVKSVTLVASDRADAFGRNDCDGKKWGCGSGESGGLPSLRSIEARTPISTPPTPCGGEYPLSNSTNIRSQTAQRTKSRADAMLERALTQPQQCSVDPLNNAQNWGIPIWATKRLQAWLEKIYESLKDSDKSKRRADQSNAEKSLKVKHLKNSYIKLESFKRDTRPVFVELPVWPKLNFDGDPGTCPFDARLRERKVRKEESDTLNKQKGKEMTRRPRATATRGRRTEQLVAAGSCEICRVDYRDLSKHLQSDKHLAFVRNDDNFLSLDKLITSGASVEAFLRANQVGQDCGIFPEDGDGKVHGGVEDEDAKLKESGKGDLSSFTVQDIKMVRCNGARRNLNLKLSSAHNLRTRSKKESGHLLRSKGSPWHELQDKSDKFYDKLEGFTIKKRAKGTIWIEEEEEEEEEEGENPATKKCPRIDVVDVSFVGENNYSSKSKESREGENTKKESPEDRVLPKLERNDLTIASDIENDDSCRIVNIPPRLEKETRTINGDDLHRRNGEASPDDSENGFNGFEGVRAPESLPASQLPGNSSTKAAASISQRQSPLREKTRIDGGRRELETVCNGVDGEEKEKFGEKLTKDEKAPRVGVGRFGKRSGSSFRGRPRLSVEERLIEDNRAYYKVEVLGNKLRSSTGPWSAASAAATAAANNRESNELAGAEEAGATGSVNGGEASSEKPVVVRFKRVRRSELSLLSDEAESFMFGESKRGEEENNRSEVSEADRSSLMPRDTESDWESGDAGAAGNSTFPSSTLDSRLSSKREPPSALLEEDCSRDSTCAGGPRARKRRRTQPESSIKENNEDRDECQTSGSRSRLRAALTGPEETLYPSKPSPEVEKMQFSFEAVPRSEPWYQTYRRQDEGAEFWHYFSEADERKPFLLPYEIENFHERLAKLCRKSSDPRRRRKGRGRGRNGMGRSPRKSPRCHASTLAIMSTIIRKREQQQPATNVSVVAEESRPRSSDPALDEAPTPEPKQQQQQRRRQDRSTSQDVELREIATSIDAMLNAVAAAAAAAPDPDDSFEALLVQQSRDADFPGPPSLQPGPPSNLLDLLDNCHEYSNCLENSSCASSECGEPGGGGGGGPESPLKRRKKRKNRTGWPGIKMRKKLRAKQLIDAYVARERLAANKISEDETRTEKRCRAKDEGLSSRSEEPPSVRKNSASFENEEIGALANDENHCRADANNPASARQLASKIPAGKRQRARDTSDDKIIENNDNFYINSVNSTIISRKNYPGEDMSKRRRPRDNDSTATPAESNDRGLADHRPGDVNACQKDSLHAIKATRTRKRQRPGGALRSSELDHEDENCKSEPYTSGLKANGKTEGLRGVERRNEAGAEETLRSDLDCGLAERVSPSLLPTTELQNRRSSMEFQPVVRMMKIEDQVDMDHGVLSVTVASNRRLRSSSSPRSNLQPIAKRYKRSKGPFGRWIKNS